MLKNSKYYKACDSRDFSPRNTSFLHPSLVRLRNGGPGPSSSSRSPFLRLRGDLGAGWRMRVSSPLGARASRDNFPWREENKKNNRLLFSWAFAMSRFLSTLEKILWFRLWVLSYPLPSALAFLNIPFNALLCIWVPSYSSSPCKQGK